MITEDMMRTTEMMMMPYLFDLTDWLMGKKTIHPTMGNGTKEDWLPVLREDYRVIREAGSEELSTDLLTTLTTLESMTETHFQQTKARLLAWEPVAQ